MYLQGIGAPAPGNERVMTGTTILLADDEAHITHVVGAKLRSGGYETVVAADGVEAFELALEHRPALVVTDLQMPRESGVDLARRLRSTPETKDIPVVLLTARGYFLSQEDTEETNIKRVLSKPFTARGLLELVNELLAKPAEAA